MHDRERTEPIREAKEKWERTTLHDALARHPERLQEFDTTSGKPMQPLYTPLDI